MKIISKYRQAVVEAYCGHYPVFEDTSICNIRYAIKEFAEMLAHMWRRLYAELPFIRSE